MTSSAPEFARLEYAPRKGGEEVAYVARRPTEDLILLRRVSGSVITTDLEPTSYRGALLSTLLHATVYIFTQLAEFDEVKLFS
jgi:hypothetical protein